MLASARILPNLPDGLAIGLLLLGLALAVLSVGFWIWSSRRLRREARRIVRSVEDIRAGEPSHRPEVASDSALESVADSIHRLGRDVHSRLAEAERAGDRWRALTEAAADTAVITTDIDGDIRSFSPGAENLFGWDEDQVISQAASVVFEESSYKNLLPKLARRSLRKEGVRTRSKLLRRDGTTFDAETTVRTLTGADNETIGFMMVVHDITSQIELESRLRRSDERHRNLIEELDEGLVIVRDGRVLFVNPAGERLLGRDAREILDRPLRDRICTRDVLIVEDLLAAVQARPNARERFRCTLIESDASTGADVQVQARQIDFEGQPTVMLLIQDETAARRIERELRSNQGRLDAVMEAASDGIVVFAEEPLGERVLMTNRAFGELFGLEPEMYLGLPSERLGSILHARGGALSRVAELIAGRGETDEAEALTLEGDRQRDLQIQVGALIGPDGERLGRVMACRDLTEQRHSERELQAEAERLQLSKVELEQAYRRLNAVNLKLQGRSSELDRLNQELQRLDEMKSNLLGNVSHELQTPLVSIRGYTEMVLKERLGPISEEQRKGLQLSLKNIDRLISMIDNLVGFSRAGAEMGTLRLARFSLRALVEEASETLRTEQDRRGVMVDIDIDHGDMLIYADRDKIMQVFVNLLSNAIKYSHSRGRIEVDARAHNEQHATVQIRDGGAGIPADSLGRIFERHYQVPRAQGEAREGSGIGLSIVRDILRVHGARIDVESREGQGTTFSFTLPLAEKSSGDPGSFKPSEPEQDPAQELPGQSETGGKDADPPGRPRLRIIRRDRS